ncbi:MAG: hypothetical protein Kow0067_06350 [Coriobacteriia bacterium]
MRIRTRRWCALLCCALIASLLVPSTALAALPFTVRSITNNGLISSEAVPDLDGRYLVYSWSSALLPGNGVDVIVYDLKTGSTRSLSGAGNQSNPRIAEPWVVYMDDAAGDAEIKAYNIEEDSTVTLTANGTDDVGPDIDGTLVAWMDSPVTPRNIRWRDLATGETGTVPGVSHPNGVTVDKRRIVYYDDKVAGTWGVYVYNVDTGNEITVRQVNSANTSIADTCLFGDVASWTEWSNATPGDKNIVSGILSTGTLAYTANLPGIQQYPTRSRDITPFQDERSGTPDIYTYWAEEITTHHPVATGTGIQITPEAFGRRVVYEQDDDIKLSSAAPRVKRIAGANRYSTAVAIRDAHYYGTDHFVIASGEDFPDALCASGLAGALECPLLLTPGDYLPADVAASIQAMGDPTVWIVGGPAIIGSTVRNALKSTYHVEEVYGANRYETARIVAFRIVDYMNNASESGFGDTAFFVRGDEFPDALAVAPHAYALQAPIVLVEPDTLPDAAANVVRFAPIKRGYIAGGESAVSDTTKASIDTLIVANGGSATQRWWGNDRYATAVACAEAGVAAGWLDLDMIGIATGLSYADALAGGAACGYFGSPLVLTAPTTVPSAVSAYFTRNDYRFGSLDVFGGTAAVSEAVKNNLGGRLK